MPINRYIQNWFKNQKFLDLPLSEKEARIAYFFDKELAAKNPEWLAEQTKESLALTRNNFVEMNLAPHRPEPPSRSLLADIMVSGGRAALGVPEMFLHGAAGVDELLERHVLSEDGGFDLKKWARAKARDIEGFKEEELPLSQETLKGGPRSWVTGGLESAGTSLSVKLPAAVTGFALAGPLGAVLGWLSGVPLFSMAQYDQSLQEHLKRGVSEADAEEAAILEAASEGGFELLTDVIEIVTLGTGGVLSAPGKEALKKGATKVLKGAWKQSLKKGATIAGAETVGELANIGTQAEIRAGTGIDNQRFWQAIKENLGSVTVASLIFGALGGGLNLTNAHITRKLLEDKTADPERRLAAVKEVANALNKTSPEIARQWSDGALDAVNAGEPIKLTIEKPVDAAKVKAEQEKTLHQAQPLASNAESIADIGKKPQKRPESEIETLPGIPSTEIPSGAGAEMAAPMTPNEEPLITQPRSIEELEALLSPGQIQTIQDRAEELAAEDSAVDDITREYARAYLASQALRAPSPETVSGARTPSPEAEVKPGDKKTEPAKVKFIITAQDEAALKDLGYTDDQIYKMTPEEAQKIIEDKQAAPSPEKTDVALEGEGAAKPSAVQILTGKKPKAAQVEEPKAEGGEPPDKSPYANLNISQIKKRLKTIDEDLKYKRGQGMDFAYDMAINDRGHRVRQLEAEIKDLSDEKTELTRLLREKEKPDAEQETKKQKAHREYKEYVAGLTDKETAIASDLIIDEPEFALQQKHKIEKKLAQDRIAKPVEAEIIDFRDSKPGDIVGNKTTGYYEIYSRQFSPKYAAQRRAEEVGGEVVIDLPKGGKDTWAVWKKAEKPKVKEPAYASPISGKFLMHLRSRLKKAKALGLDLAGIEETIRVYERGNPEKIALEPPPNDTLDALDLEISKQERKLKAEPAEKPTSEITAADLLAEWDKQAGEMEPEKTEETPETVAYTIKKDFEADNRKAIESLSYIGKLRERTEGEGGWITLKYEKVEKPSEPLTKPEEGVILKEKPIQTTEKEGPDETTDIRRVEETETGRVRDRVSESRPALGIPPAIPSGKSPAIDTGSISERQRGPEEEAPESRAEGKPARKHPEKRGETGARPDQRDRSKPDRGAVERPAPAETAAGQPAPGSPELESKPELKEEDKNHVIAPEDTIFPRGDETKIKANIKAIKLLKKLESENRNPTPEEKKILAQYVGWGPFAQKVFYRDFDRYLKNYSEDTPEDYFTPYDWSDKSKLEKYKAWENKYGKHLHPTLGGVLTESEWESAAESTLNAFYTSREVIDSMWAMAERMGFKGGTVFEPAIGVGHFFGLMPQHIADNSSLLGVDIDSISARIAQKLYPQAHIQEIGYEKAKGIPDNSVDLVITNVPFGNFSVYDPKHKEYTDWAIHNYYFARSIDAVRPGGLVMGITSHWTLDAATRGYVREYLGNKADLVAAVRLPYTAFKKDAGTEVTTDILIFRKKDDALHGVGKNFRILKDVPAEKGKTASVNEYFDDHPDMVLGKHSLSGTMRGGEDEYTLLPTGKIEEQLAEAIEHLPENIFGEGSKMVPEEIQFAEVGAKEGVLVVKDGHIYVVEDGLLKEPKIYNSKGKLVKAISDKARDRRAKDYLKLREATKTLIDRMQQEDATDDEIDGLREDLNKIYDRFVKRNGNVGAVANSFLRKIDNEFPIVDALEDENVEIVKTTVKSGPRQGEQVSKKVITFEKAAILKRRTIWPFKEPEYAEGIEDAVKISRIYRNKVDAKYIGNLLGVTEDEARKRLLESERAYINPENGMLEPPDVYLSGNVKKKLEKVKAEVEERPEYKANIKALEAVQPEDLDIQFIHFKLGSSWIPNETVENFLQEVMGVRADVEQVRTQETSSWAIRVHSGRYDAKNTNTWGTSRREGHRLVQDCLNLKRTQVYDYWKEDGKSRSALNKEDTLAAQAKQQQIQTEFLNWARGHEKWGDELAIKYNEEFNGSVLRNFEVPDIDFFPGASHEITLRDLQKKAVVRGLQESTLLAYGVGTGKTFTYITLAMEMRRLGTARKPLIVIQNATVRQYAKDFKRLYPQAKVLIPLDNQRKGKNRKKLLSQIATGDWDAVVLPHSFFDGIADNPEREAAFVREQLDMIEEAIDEFEEKEGKQSFTVKDMKALRKRKMNRLERLLDRRKDDALTFEQLGVDALLIDEAHAYKRSEFFTKMGTVKGVDQGSAQRSTSLLLKAQYVQQKTGGKNVILATGTPISNTTAELWTMIRYIRSDLLDEFNATLFDDFAANYGDTTIAIEETETGTFKEVERFNKYVNGPELLTMFHTAADVVLTSQANLNLPKVKDDKPQNVVIDRSEELTYFIDKLREERQHWENLPGKEKRRQRHVPLVLFGQAKKAAVDLRLIDPQYYKDDPGSKLNKVVENVYDIWTETAGNRSTQVIFLDTFRDSTKTFNAHNDIKEKLIEKGIPSREIIVVRDSNDIQRESWFQRVREGKARVIIGSTQRLGIGVNIQDKLIAAHHVDAPPRPMDIEQRNGRIIREKNENSEVMIFNYGVKNTLDSVMYDRLTKKQKFIDQMLTGDIEGRTFDEPLSEEQVSFAEMNAAFAGNPLLFEKSDVEIKIKNFNILWNTWKRKVSTAIRSAKYIKSTKIPNKEIDLKEDIKFKGLIESKFPDKKVKSVNYKGETLEPKEFVKKAADELESKKAKIKKRFSGMTFGEYGKLQENGDHLYHIEADFNGFDLKITFNPDTDWSRSSALKEPSRKIKLSEEIIVEPVIVVKYQGDIVHRSWSFKMAGIFQSFRHSIDRIINQPEATRNEIDRLKTELEEYNKITKEPFAHEQELKDAEKRLAEIEKELQEGAGVKPQEEIDREYDDVEGKRIRMLKKLQKDIAELFDGAFSPPRHIDTVSKTIDFAKDFLGEDADPKIIEHLNELKENYLFKEHSLDYKTVIGGHPEYSTRTSIAKSGLPLKDIQRIFKGQAVGLSPEGHLWVKTKTGHGLVIRTVDHIAEDRAAFGVGYGRMRKSGELLAGKYQDSTIELQKDIADKWTVYHEAEHWAEDIGLLEDADIRVLNRQIQAEKKDSSYRPTKEDRARWIESNLEAREKYRQRGRLYRILQKIRDFIDALVNLAYRTAKGVAREFETGRIFERPGRPTVVRAIHESLKKEVKSVIPQYMTSKKGPGDILTTETPQSPKGEIVPEIIHQRDSKKFIGDNGKEYVGVDASNSLSLLTDEEFVEVTGYSKREFKRNGGSVYFVPASESIANSIHHISGEIVLSDTLKNNKKNLRKTLIHELTHWGQIQTGETPKAFFVSPEESIERYMEYLSDPAEVKARFNAEGRSDKEYKEFMEELIWAKSEDAGKLKPFEVGEIKIEAEKKWRMPLSYLQKEVDLAKDGKDYKDINPNQLKNNIAELEKVIGSKAGKDVVKKEDLYGKLDIISDRELVSDYDVSNINLLYIDIQRKWQYRRLGAGDRRLSENEIEYYETPVLRMEIYGKPDSRTGIREKINPIIIEKHLRKKTGIKGFAVGPNEIEIELNESNLKKINNLGKKFQSQFLPKPSSPPRKGGQKISVLPEEDIPQYSVKEIPPTGQQALDDIEKDRSFANRIFEQRDVGIKEAELETQELQKEVQRLAGPKSRRGRVAPFAYDKELKRSLESDRLDMAMMIYRDLKINPDKAQEFKQWAKEALDSPETPKGRKIQIKEYLDILDRAEKLTDEQKALVEDIGQRFDRAFLIAKANKVVNSFLDHYVRRVWNLPKGKESDFKSSGAAYGFKTFTTAKMKRSFETILDGWMAGYDLKIQGLTNSYGAYIADLEAILANKDFILQGYNTRDAEGRRMFSTSRKGEHKDYAPLKAPGFKIWEWAGRVETDIAPDESNALIIDDYGRKFFFGAVEREPETWAVFKIDEEGNQGKRALRVFLDQESAEEFAAEKDFETHIDHRLAKDIADAWEERQLYAPKQLAEIINKMTARSRLSVEVPGKQALLRFNAVTKSWLLLSSFFHHIAGGRSWGFAIHHGWKAGKELKDPLTGETYKTSGWNPVKAYRAGLKKIEDRAPIAMLAIKNGLTTGRMQDFDESMLRDQKGYIQRLANYLGLEKTGKLIEHGGFLREKFTGSLFNKFFTGLKMEAFTMEYVHELQEAQNEYLKKGGSPPDVNKIAEKVARLINADFGGLHLERMGRNPDLQAVARLLLFAPDWCVDSKTRAMTKTGWKSYDELSLDDEIMAFDPQSKKLKWSKIKDKYVNEHYIGEMVKIKNHNRAVMMTPDHTCYVYNITTKRNDIVKASALQTNHTIPRCADFDAPTQETYNDYYIKLVGWMVTDGYVKKSSDTLADGTMKEYRYGKITQSKPKTVKILKEMGLKYHADKYNSDHDDFVSNYKKYVFTVPADEFQRMEAEGVSEGLTWDFLSKLTHRQLKVLYDTMMLADGTGQNRFCGREQPVFFMTLIQTMLGRPSTFYRQEKNCWRTRCITPKTIYCWGHNNNTQKVDYSGTIWCPSVETGFWLAEREGLMFITGNTESNFRTVTGMIPGLNEWINKKIGDVPPPPGMDKLYRRFWFRVITRIAVSTLITQFLLNGWDDTWEFYKEQMSRDRFFKFRWTEVDVSKIYKALGIDLKGTRKTFSIGGHFFDILKLMNPARLIMHKGSPIVRIGEALTAGKDWRERPFTGVGEFVKTGKTIKESPYDEKEQFWIQLLPLAVNQAINLQPIQIGYGIRYLQGEEDFLSFLLQSAGMHMHTAWPPKVEGPIVPSKDEDSVYDAIQELIETESLKMGPPSKRITAAGIPKKLTAAQYNEYLQESSDIVRRRLKDLIGSDRWEQMTPKQKARIVEKVIKSARKKARQKLKKRYWKTNIRKAA